MFSSALCARPIACAALWVAASARSSRGDRAQDHGTLLDPVAGHVPLRLRGAQLEFGTGGDRVAEFLGQLDQAAQQVPQLLDRDAADRLGAGHLRQQEAHLGIVVLGLAQRQQGVERGQHVARQRRDAVDGAPARPRPAGRACAGGSAPSPGFPGSGRRVCVLMSAREKAELAVSAASSRSTSRRTSTPSWPPWNSAVNGGQHRLRALQVEDLLDFVRRDAVLEVRGERIVSPAPCHGVPRRGPRLPVCRSCGIPVCEREGGRCR